MQFINTIVTCVHTIVCNTWANVLQLLSSSLWHTSSLAVCQCHLPLIKLRSFFSSLTTPPQKKQVSFSFHEPLYIKKNTSLCPCVSAEQHSSRLDLHDNARWCANHNECLLLWPLLRILRWFGVLIIIWISFFCDGENWGVNYCHSPDPHSFWVVVVGEELECGCFMVVVGWFHVWSTTVVVSLCSIKTKFLLLLRLWRCVYKGVQCTVCNVLYVI